jgi:hypothetical protein
MESERFILNQIRMIDLINSGIVGLDDKFRFMSGKKLVGGEISILSNGNFEIPGELEVSSPSSLARHISGGKTFNGWKVIVRVRDSTTLFELRNKHIQVINGNRN